MTKIISLAEARKQRVSAATMRSIAIWHSEVASDAERIGKAKSAARHRELAAGCIRLSDRLAA